MQNQPKFAFVITLVDFAAGKLIRFRSRQSENKRKAVETNPVLPAPLGPLLHGIEDRLIAIAAKIPLHGRAKAMNHGALVDEPKVAVKEIMADHEVASDIELARALPR